MSQDTLEGIQTAIQAHLDDTKDDKEQLVDFVVVRASLTSDGAWAYGYTLSPFISPHGSEGLVNRVREMIREDLSPKD